MNLQKSTTCPVRFPLESVATISGKNFSNMENGPAVVNI